MIELLHGKLTRVLGRCTLSGLLVLGLYAFSALSNPHKNTITGRAFVVDGDTIDITGHRVRLQGIDAPENTQNCPAGQFAHVWQAGKAARYLLIRIIDNQPVICQSYGTDIHNRTLGVCRAGDI